MINGIVTLRDVLLHPIAVIWPYGFRKYCEILMKGISKQHYQFLPIVLGKCPSPNSYNLIVSAKKIRKKNTQTNTIR